MTNFTIDSQNYEYKSDKNPTQKPENEQQKNMGFSGQFQSQMPMYPQYMNDM